MIAVPMIESVPVSAFNEVPIWDLCSRSGLLMSELSRPQTRETYVNSLTPHIKRNCLEGAIKFPPYAAFKVDDLTVGGNDLLFWKDTVSFFESNHPEYILNYFHNQEELKSSKSNIDVLTIDEPVAWISHWNVRTYGHFLIEVLPKIMAFKLIRLVHPELKLLLSDFMGTGFLRIIQNFVDAESCVFFSHKTQRVLCAKVIMFRSLVEAGAIHPFMEQFVHLAQVSAPHKAKFPRKIFVSKAKWRTATHDYRVLSNESSLAAELQNQGIVTIYPEQHHWLDQVSIFSGAEVVVGEFTSALHNTIFCAPRTRIVAINYVNELQDEIAAYANHTIGYVMPIEGKPIEWGSASKTAAYEVDIEQVKTLLRS